MKSVPSTGSSLSSAHRPSDRPGRPPWLVSRAVCTTLYCPAGRPTNLLSTDSGQEITEGRDGHPLPTKSIHPSWKENTLPTPRGHTMIPKSTCGWLFSVVHTSPSRHFELSTSLGRRMDLLLPPFSTWGNWESENRTYNKKTKGRGNINGKCLKKTQRSVVLWDKSLHV